jgi:hypothetical protein
MIKWLDAMKDELVFPCKEARHEIDAVHFAEHVVLAVVGIESNGQKHVPGLREGATRERRRVQGLTCGSDRSRTCSAACAIPCGGSSAGRRYDDSALDRGVLEAEHHFRKVAGYRRALPKLVSALRAHDAAIDRKREVENGKRAASVS